MAAESVIRLCKNTTCPVGFPSCCFRTAKMQLVCTLAVADSSDVKKTAEICCEIVVSF